MARNMQSHNFKSHIEAFQNATSQTYGYMVRDHHYKTPEDRRYVTCILPGERLVVYTRRSNL